MTWAAVAVGAGTAISAGSSAAGASAQNNASRGQRQAQQWNTSYGENTLGLGLFGPSYMPVQAQMSSLLYKLSHGSLTWEQAKPLWDKLTSSPEYQQYQQATGGAAIPQLRQIADQFTKSGDQQLGKYDQGTNELRQMGTGLSGMAANYGKGQASLINTGYDKALRSANDTSMARLNASGLGASTAVSNQLAGNQRENEFNRQASLSSLGNSQIDRQMQQGNSNMGMLANRMQGRDTMWGSLQDRNLNLKLMPINAAQTGLGSIANMWAGQPVSQGPGLSPGGSAMSNIGNTLAQFGSMGMLANMYGGRGGGGGGGGYGPGQQWNPSGGNGSGQW